MKHAMIVCMTLLALGGAQAAQVSSGDGLALTLADDGRVQTVNVNGKLWPMADAPSGLLLRDVAADGELGTNLAVLPVAKARADSNFSGYTPAPLSDGSIRTKGLHWTKIAWASAERAGEHWAEIELPAAMPVSAVVIYWATDGGLQTSRTYRVQAEVGGAWRDLASVTGQSPREMNVHTFAPRTAQRVRVLQSDAGGPAGRPNIMWIREIEVY